MAAPPRRDPALTLLLDEVRHVERLKHDPHTLASTLDHHIGRMSLAAELVERGERGGAHPRPRPAVSPSPPAPPAAGGSPPAAAPPAALLPGSTPAIVSANIKKLLAEGRPNDVAQAAALSNARRHPSPGYLVVVHDGEHVVSQHHAEHANAAKQWFEGWADKHPGRGTKMELVQTSGHGVSKVVQTRHRKRTAWHIER